VFYLQEVETVQNAPAGNLKSKSKKPGRPKPNKTKFDPTLVNKDLSLRDLRLDRFSGCYKMDNNVNILHIVKNICESAKIPLQIVYNDEKAFQASIYMNKKFVCHGNGKSRILAKDSAVQTAFRYLQYKGVTLWDALKLESRFVLSKSVEDLGETKSIFRRNFEALVEEMIVDPGILQIRVLGAFRKHVADDWRRSAMLEVVKRYHLRKDLRMNLFRATKINSFLHKFHVYPSLDDPNRTEIGKTQVNL
jgi:hypothetical protein